MAHLPNKVLLFCLPITRFPQDFPASPVWAAARLVTLTRGPCLLVYILTQGARFPVRHSAPTTLAPWISSEVTRVPLSQPWGRATLPGPKTSRGWSAQIYLKAIHSARPRSLETGVLCPACLSSLVLLSCSFPTSESGSPSHTDGMRSDNPGQSPSFGILQSTTIPLIGHLAEIWSQPSFRLSSITSTF